jgi:tRNA(Ile)-lysidine synthase
MIEQFLYNIERLGGKEARYLLAVSGGLDSTLMVHFAHDAGLDFGIAHCNFQLRGAESDAEEQFVKKTALTLAVPFYSVQFDTRQWLKENNKSLQEGARILRYEWLEEVRGHQGYDYILTAHHLNDSLETFLYNFSKGTGIKGLTGIPYKNGMVIRPMLDYARPDLKAYAREKDIDYCLDSSNESDDYTRNKIRHHIVPILKEINPSLETTFGDTLSHLQQASDFLDFHLQKLRKETITVKGNILYFSKNKILSHPQAQFFLFEMLQGFGFNGAMVQDVLQQSKGSTGQTWIGKGHTLWNEREYWVLEKDGFKANPPLLLSNNPGSIRYGTHTFEFENLSYVPDAYKDATQDTAYLDADKIQWPLVFRHWEEGDVFQPLGMPQQSQKLQDFFTNQKVDRFQKKRILLLEIQNKIAWVVNMRISDHFKITGDTSNVLRVRVVGL